MKKKTFLTPKEFELFFKCAGTTEHPVRNQCFFLLMYRHGFRVSELLMLRLQDIDLEERLIACNRLKRGKSTVHPMKADEVKLLEAYLAIRAKTSSKILFHFDQGAPTRQAINYLCGAISKKCGLPHVNPHMLRHSAGYALVNKTEGKDLRLIQDYLGHRNIQSTVRYTEVCHTRFTGLWS